MSVIDTLITDRTIADQIGKTEKGQYRSGDLNRVGLAMQYVANQLAAAGYAPNVKPKTDWTDIDASRESDMAKYLADLAELRSHFAQAASTPAVPGTMDALTYSTANDIEQILFDISHMLDNIAAGWYYSGDLMSGEV